MTEQPLDEAPAEESEPSFQAGVENPPEKPYQAREIRIFRAPKSTPRMTVHKQRSYIRIRPVQAAPISYPERYISLLDNKNEEVAFVEDLSELDETSRQVIREELGKRYLTAVIRQIRSIQMEFGVSYWDVVTDRGEREFITRGHEGIVWLSDTRLLLTDVSGNRFEILDYTKLDANSVKLIESQV